jgi:3'(2'), 5'-bisphosphate nucleotidase
VTDAELAASLAEQAGALLLRMRAESGEQGPALGMAADRAANALIVEALQRLRPQDGLLSEEAADTLARLQRSRVWIVDPLDGTREFADRRDDWAVHVALAIDGLPAIGAVALPARSLLFRSDAPPQPPPERHPPRMIVSRSRPPAQAAPLAAALGAEIVTMGSAGAKAMAVLLGEAEIYFHSGGQHEWDNCAPAAVALAAGLHASRIDGAPLLYNRADTAVPDLIICRPDLASRVITALSQYC